MYRKFAPLVALLLLLSLILPATAAQDPNTGADGPSTTAATYSHRLIVQLTSPSLAEYYASLSGRPGNPLSGEGSKLDPAAPAAQAYLQQLETEQQAFIAQMQQAIPNSHVSTYLDELGAERQDRYQIVFNGMAVDAGRNVDVKQLEQQLSQLSGVKNVYRDFAHDPDLYASVPLINAQAAWDNAAIGGMANAGAGVKFASVDGGAHHLAPMFDGTGYTYPPGYPKGDTRNTNGKIIVSRAYFRTWDPPSAGDENAWPGTQGTPHGVHTASTVAGDPVTATYLGVDVPISGVAPKAYVMSYRVFYNSITNNGSFYNAEGIKALEDMVADGADVNNNSWGGGPTSVGGEGDPLDVALVNAVRSGVFVSMSNGNAGPDLGTGDHSSPEYINVAASQSGGTFAAGRFQVAAPTPVPGNLTAMPYGTAQFGPPLPTGTIVGPFSYKYATDVDPTNLIGCKAWPANAFQGVAAVIERGTCNFSEKAYWAQQAGATFVVIYNNAANGDTIINMAAGTYANLVTIPSIHLGRTNGLAIRDWLHAHPADAQVQLNTQAYQIGNVPDVIAGFSSRGPGVGNVLKPDITAPGVNILAQGFASGVTGEDRHLGFGQASGTSMAAPHVTGAAALLKQIHPTWSPAYIKSALMSTSKYLNIWLDEAKTQPAQPLDMGAGRLDLTNAADPGVILDPPSLSFGQVTLGTSKCLNTNVTSVGNATETYNLTTLYTGGGFNNPPTLTGMTLYPTSLTLAPGQTKQFTACWVTAAQDGYGDQQGFVVLTGSTHNAHMPAWMRTAYWPSSKDVLILQDEQNYSNYTSYYTTALANLGLTYNVWNVKAQGGVPDANYLAQYHAVILETGDNYVTAANNTLWMDRLTEYFNNGGRVIAFGQDLGSVTGGAVAGSEPVFYSSVLGAKYLQDSVSNYEVFGNSQQLLGGLSGSPWTNMSFDMSAMGDGAANQYYVDEIGFACNDPDTPSNCRAWAPTLKYAPGGFDVQNGWVGMSNRDQPTLENPFIINSGRALFFTFGLEGINDDTGANTREELLGTSMDWLNDVETVTITPDPKKAGDVSYFTANVNSTAGGDGVFYRWDFGDGSPFSVGSGSKTAGHTYAQGGQYTVRVEATNDLGTRAVGEVQITVPSCGVNFTVTTASASARQGTTIDYNLTIHNNGNVVDTYTFGKTGGAWTCHVPPAAVTLDPGQSADVTVHVDVPVGTPGHAQDTVSVSAMSQTDPSKTATVDVTTIAWNQFWLPFTLQGPVVK